MNALPECRGAWKRHVEQTMFLTWMRHVRAKLTQINRVDPEIAPLVFLNTLVYGMGITVLGRFLLMNPTVRTSQSERHNKHANRDPNNIRDVYHHSLWKALHNKYVAPEFQSEE